jgi:hypothetical protein
MLFALLGLIAVGLEISVSSDMVAIMLADMGEPMPLLTRCLLSPGVHGWLSILTAFAVILVVKEFLAWNATLKLLVNLAGLLSAIGFIELYRFAMVMPIYQMIQNLQR